MAPRVSFSHFKLDYPPWALDFDPCNRGYLLVGGGGGEGQKEVPNRLTLLDISSPSLIEKVAELDVVDDSPASLGVLATKDGLFAFAGINSRKADREQGNNEHLRSFKVDYVRHAANGTEKPSSPGKIEPLSRIRLFSPSYSQSIGDAFQRLLRLSPSQLREMPNKRVGAIANSLAKESEIVVFDATAATPDSKDVIHRIFPLRNAEANDLDIIEPSPQDFRIAFCTPHEVYLSSISYDFTSRKPKAPIGEPVCLHSLSHPDASEKRVRSKYRCLRFLSSTHLLLLVNHGGQSELQVLRIYQEGGPGDVVTCVSLPKRLGAAVSLDVCPLDADPITGARQMVIAVAAQAQDVFVYTLDYDGNTKSAKFNLYTEISGAHPAPMKKVVLSPFYFPPHTKGQRYLRLASISLSNTLILDTLPLRLLDPGKKGSRYVLSKSSRASSLIRTGASLFVAAFALLVSLLLLQSYLAATSPSGAQSYLPSSWQDALASYRHRVNEVVSPLAGGARKASVDAVHPSNWPTPRQPVKRLRELLRHAAQRGEGHEAPIEAKEVIVIGAGQGADTLSTEMHADDAETLRKKGAKPWEELSDDQRTKWKAKLSRAGAWAVEEGETVLKGVFFSEVAGAVGRAVLG
ncbi:hypothetical protein EJ06DRAFT_552650 [Trichodelitschia bisporula]|uniref:Guanine nucleotide-exchange factor SEC12 n=1 Tax=Trichodelitschia bisporula TaxID=703511 RepID=A0A6G1IAC1_9PEZI|nr:hypothetical protein EJ06DRAFT_552650 [Trichodelitschia bisporula]